MADFLTSSGIPPTGPTEQDLSDHIDVMDALEAPSGSYVEEQIAREEQDRAAIDALQGLREIQTTEPVRWAIERIDGEGSPGLLAKWPTVLLKWERIRDEFGPGTYRVEGRLNSGKYVQRRTITIADDAPRKVKDYSMHASAAPAFNVTEFMAQQEARDAQRREADERHRREREEREDKRRAEFQQLLLTALPAAATVFAAMFQGNRGPDLGTLLTALKPAPPPDPIATLVALRQLSESPKGPAPMEQALHLFEVLSDKAGSSGRTDWLDVVKEGVKILGPSVGGAIEQTLTQARTNVQANGAAHGTSPDGAEGATPAALPAPAGGISPEPHPVISGDGNMLELLPHIPFLRTQLAKMANAAARGRDTDVYAAMFLEELPDGLPPVKVLELLSRSDWLQQLSRFDARIPQQAPWWTQLREDLAGYIQEATQPQPVPKRTGQPADIERPVTLPSLNGET
jgi:hypothetical protein